MAARRELSDPQRGDGRELMQALVHVGFGVNDQDDEGETPLHWAAFTGAAWTTSFLIRHGANPMINSFSGEQPLQIARARPTTFLDSASPSEFAEIETTLEAAELPWRVRA
jgi:ankyrin repeat protein